MKAKVILLITLAVAWTATAEVILPPVTAVALNAQLSGANAIPTNDSPLVATASLTLIFAPQVGVSSVLYGTVVFPFCFLPPPLRPDAITFEDEAGNSVLSAARPSSEAFPPLPPPLPIVLARPVPPTPLTPQQAADLLAGRWFIHVSTVSAFTGKPYPQGDTRGRIMPVDSDGDGVADYLDQCPGTPAGVLVETHGCSIEQLCPCNAQWSRHGEYVTCVTKAAAAFSQAGLITRSTERAISQAAAASDCGKRLTPAAPFSGITGQSVFPFVLACQNCGVPSPISIAFPTSIKVFSDSSVLVTEVFTDAQGQFQIHLKEGTYRLVPWNPPPPEPIHDCFGDIIYPAYPYTNPVDVTVPFKQFANVIITYNISLITPFP